MEIPREEESGYIPYEATARSIVESDTLLTSWLYEVFPDATSNQVEMAIFNILGIFHEGLVTGLSMSDIDDPIDVIEAFQKGIKAGSEGTERVKNP